MCNDGSASPKSDTPFPYSRIHRPVMLDEVIEHLAPQSGKVYLDGTFGEGGYTKRILDEADCKVFAIDQDPCAIDKAHMLAQAYPDRLEVKWHEFGKLDALNRTFDGIVLDIGLSSGQLASDRGFSFKTDSPLDMRMSSTSTHGSLRRLIPADVALNQFSVDKLAGIFRQYGQERFARPIANEIDKRRAKAPFATTHQLVDAVLAAVPKRYAREATIHPATRVFQSLRIYVNDELGQLQSALASAANALNPGGRLVVVSFHSLEDAMIKKHFRALAQETALSEKESRDNGRPDDAVFRILTKRAARPASSEIEQNPRSRSAKLRALERVVLIR
ncbi:hypothetical protein GGI15_001666 [Coemansia interrupta]|uniref:Uncharacterized protein n=1 Tax=Coemansia interrupta TaxID=1126814 RepID=A0A9W8HNW3_9FUNG|nr:hypothetical protein GGI15_001666 [Coemansia interrupta]